MKKLFLRLQPPVFLRRLCSFILAFVLAFGLWFGSSERVEAAGPFLATYEDVPFYFCRGNFSLSCGTNNDGYNSVTFEFSNPDAVYTLFYKTSSRYSYASYSTDPDCIITRTVYRDEYEPDVASGTFSYSGYNMSVLEYVANSSFVKYEDYGLSASAYRSLFQEFVDSGEAADFISEVPTIYYFEKHSPQMDIAFSLKKATASVQDGILSASWNGTTDMSINLYKNSIVDVSINYTDQDSGTTYDIQYPIEAAASGLNVNFVKPGNTYCLVSDNGFEIELSELEEEYFNTTNYTINSICLTPYYYGNDNVISDNIYMGLSSVVNIGYDSTVADDVISDSTQVILPGTNYNPENPFKSLYDQQNDLFQGMINGYDNTGMNQDNGALSDSLSGYDAATGAIFDSASDTLDSFSFEDNLNFSVGLVTALGFVKGFVDDFFIASGDFSVIVTVVFTLIFMSMVIGIARFKGK